MERAGSRAGLDGFGDVPRHRGAPCPTLEAQLLPVCPVARAAQPGARQLPVDGLQDPHVHPLRVIQGTCGEGDTTQLPHNAPGVCGQSPSAPTTPLGPQKHSLGPKKHLTSSKNPPLLAKNIPWHCKTFSSQTHGPWYTKNPSRFSKTPLSTQEMPLGAQKTPNLPLNTLKNPENVPQCPEPNPHPHST